ncbi:hypothetical protein DFH27DRAFT_558452 [Peziza echinospora]|nr:hypothetical protein DFH27DRAFT_558452 [Peziza echinospora]
MTQHYLQHPQHSQHPQNPQHPQQYAPQHQYSPQYHQHHMPQTPNMYPGPSPQHGQQNHYPPPPQQQQAPPQHYSQGLQPINQKIASSHQQVQFIQQGLRVLQQKQNGALIPPSPNAAPLGQQQQQQHQGYPVPPRQPLFSPLSPIKKRNNGNVKEQQQSPPVVQMHGSRSGPVYPPNAFRPPSRPQSAVGSEGKRGGDGPSAPATATAAHDTTASTTSTPAEVALPQPQEGTGPAPGPSPVPEPAT